MGTLFDQPPRKHHDHLLEKESMIDFVEHLQEVCDRTGINFDQALKVAEIMSMERSNNIMVNDNDVKDEQLAGFGKLIERFLSEGVFLQGGFQVQSAEVKYFDPQKFR